MRAVRGGASRPLIACDRCGRDGLRHGRAPPAGVSTLVPATIRLARRASTLPGPTSMKRVAPASCRAVNVSRQRTGRISARRARRARPRTGRAEAQEKTVKRGLAQLDVVERGAEGAHRGGHRGRVEGARHRQPDRALAELAGELPRRGRSSRGRPASTIWPGALSLATVRPAASAILAASSASAPTSAIIEPRSSASAIRLPRSTTSSSASSTVSTPAAASAASSPSEWPAAASGAMSAASPRQPAIDAQKIAGCWKRVLSSTRANGILADQLEAALEQLRAALRDEVAHLGGLAALAGEQQRQVRARTHANTLIAARREILGRAAAYPPAGG